MLYRCGERWWKEENVESQIEETAEWVRKIHACPDDEEEDEVLLWSSYTLLGDILGYCLRHALPKAFTIEDKFDALKPLWMQPKL